LARFLLDCTASTFAFHRDSRGFDGLYLHDPLAMLVAARPDLCEWETYFVDVECEGELTRGMTLADLRGWSGPPWGIPAEVCAKVRSGEALELFRRGVFDG
jgi:inosine-uridine nucleoside N-ribohydrolase